MPVIAQTIFGINVKDDGLIEILKDEIQRCGCLDLIVESDKLNTPVGHLLEAMRSIDGVVCNDENVCCVTDIAGFSDKLKKFRGES